MENKYIIIPIEQIKKETLDAIVEDFILREGTDYGLQEVSFEKKKEQILKQINKNDLLITFDMELESCQILNKNNFHRLNKQNNDCDNN